MISFLVHWSNSHTPIRGEGVPWHIFFHPTWEGAGTTHQYTTIIAPHHFHNPASISNGASTITNLSPLNQHLINRQAINLLNAGCTIELSTFLSFSLLKMISPNLALSKDPSTVFTIEGPKWETRARRAGVLGSTTSRASTSKSMRGILYSEARTWDTVDLPALELR